ncbi:ankyrin repeat-containing domain protein, partial [Immersiella caudata]
VDMIPSKGAEVDPENNHGDTPLMLAARKYHQQIAKLLLAKGADVNKWGKRPSQTPLLLAIGCGHLEMARLLIESAADVRASAKGNASPLIAAIKANH